MVHQDLYYQLGLLQVPWDQVDAAMKLVHERANAQHTTGARGYAELFCGSEPTGKRLCYDSGVDGTDGKYWIEDIPAVHVDWEMTEEEWEELRSALWYLKDPGPYIRKLRSAGKLGNIPAPDVLTAHRVAYNSISRSAKCECGAKWRSTYPPYGPHPCLNDPEHVA